MQHNAYAWAYHSVYNLQGKKVYERNDVSIDYYSENLLILKDNKGYYFCFTNGSRSKYYSFLKKLPNGKIKEEHALQSNTCEKGILNGKQAFSEALKSQIFSVNPVNKLFYSRFLKEERFPANKTSEDAFLIFEIL